MRLVHRALGKRSTGFHESRAFQTFMKRILPTLPILAVLAAIHPPVAPAESPPSDALYHPLTGIAETSGDREELGFPYMPPNDPYYAPTHPTYGFGQWNLRKYTYVEKKHPEDDLVLDSGICATLAWRITTGSEDVVVCIMDSGINVYNTDLKDKLWTNYGEIPGNRIDDDGNGYVDDIHGWDSYDDDGDIHQTEGSSGHGTGTAGIACAGTNNLICGAGVAPDCPVMGCRVADDYLCFGESLAEAVTYAAGNGAGVFSMSIGAIGHSPWLESAFQYAYDHGVLPVCAMANEFSIHHNVPTWYDDVLGVGAIGLDSAVSLLEVDPDSSWSDWINETLTSFRRKQNFSNYGAHLHVMAPTNVPCATGYSFGGTSAATPHAGGAAALIFSCGMEQGLDLSPGEAKQLLCMTADDIDEHDEQLHVPEYPFPYPVQKGWDQYTGYGRINLHRALRAIRSGRIPPVVDINEPGWYEIIEPAQEVNITAEISSRTYPVYYTLEIAPGVDPPNEEEQTWITLRDGSIYGPYDSTLYDGTLPVLVDPDATPENPDDFTVTLRLRVIDPFLNMGEDRMAIFQHEDHLLQDGFPRRLGTSGESSPTIADLDGDGIDDIVFGTARGMVFAIDGDGADLQGWPVHTDSVATQRYREIPPGTAGIIATVAVADIDGESGMEVVACALDGKVYAWQADGSRLAPFPVQTDPPTHGSLHRGFIASPVLCDLDIDGKLEIIAASMDQKLYVYNHDGTYFDGNGDMVPDWPIWVRDFESGGDVAKLTFSPAVADLDGDGFPEILIGSGEKYAAEEWEIPPSFPEELMELLEELGYPLSSTRVHAYHKDGSPLQNWPVRLLTPVPAFLPVIGEGVTSSPVVADFDGDGAPEVALTTMGTGIVEDNGGIYNADGSLMTDLNYTVKADWEVIDPYSISYITLGAAGDIDGDGDLDLVQPTVGIAVLPAAFISGRNIPIHFFLSAWDAISGDALYPRPPLAEDWQFIHNPILADLDGDGVPEVIHGSGAYLLHATSFADDDEPREAEGWPRFTGGWIMASPAAGDVDGDGLLEIVAVTREGNLFCWNTDGGATGEGTPWPQFRRDPRNTGNLMMDPDN